MTTKSEASYARLKCCFSRKREREREREREGGRERQRERDRERQRVKVKGERETESKLKERLTEGVNSKCEGHEDWCDLKRKLLDVAGEVCHYTKCKPRHSEMWWRNKNVDATVCRK